MKLSTPLVLLTLALSTPSQAAPKEACEKIENMLLSVQLASTELSDANFDSMNESLKSAHQKYCETELPSGLSEAMSVVMTYDDGSLLERDGRFYMPDGREFLEDTRRQDDLLEDAISRGGNPAVLSVFTSAHNRCAPGCRFVSWGIWGDPRHQAKRSCHNSGQAIDIHAIVCNGKTYPALSGRFNEYASCMRGSMGVIYGKGDHRDHAHIELHNCEMCVGLHCHGMRIHNGGGAGDGGGKHVKQKRRRARR